MRLGAVATIVMAMSLMSASPASANGSLSASRTGVKSTGYVSFSTRYAFKVTDWYLSDTRCDSHSVIAYVFTNFGRVTERENSSGCGSRVKLPDVSWRSERGRVQYVYLRVCVNSSFGNECSNGNRQYNQYR